jgi:hypothetical protein
MHETSFGGYHRGAAVYKGRQCPFHQRDTDRGRQSVEDHAPHPNSAIRRAQYSEVDFTIEKLQHKFGEGHGPLSDEEVAAVVREETEELQDSPVQAFTSLIAENNARNRLQELAEDADREH